jgi:hypothetical protein
VKKIEKKLSKKYLIGNRKKRKQKCRLLNYPELKVGFMNPEKSPKVKKSMIAQIVFTAKCAVIYGADRAEKKK